MTCSLNVVGTTEKIWRADLVRSMDGTAWRTGWKDSTLDAGSAAMLNRTDSRRDGATVRYRTDDRPARYDTPTIMRDFAGARTATGSSASASLSQQHAVRRSAPRFRSAGIATLPLHHRRNPRDEYPPTARRWARRPGSPGQRSVEARERCVPRHPRRAERQLRDQRAPPPPRSDDSCRGRVSIAVLLAPEPQQPGRQVELQRPVRYVVAPAAKHVEGRNRRRPPTRTRAAPTRAAPRASPSPPVGDCRDRRAPGTRARPPDRRPARRARRGAPSAAPARSTSRSSATSPTSGATSRRYRPGDLGSSSPSMNAATARSYSSSGSVQLVLTFASRTAFRMYAESRSRSLPTISSFSCTGAPSAGRPDADERLIDEVVRRARRREPAAHHRLQRAVPPAPHPQPPLPRRRMLAQRVESRAHVRAPLGVVGVRRVERARRTAPRARRAGDAADPRRLRPAPRGRPPTSLRDASGA